MIKTYDNYDENDDFDDDFEYEEADDELELIDDELYKIGDEDDFPIIKTPANRVPAIIDGDIHHVATKDLVPAMPTHLAAPGVNLGAYINTVHQIPILTPEEEKELAQRYYNHHDVEAARMLVMSHLRFVIHIARSYSGYGLSQADLIQEGNLGLMKAVKRFDPNKGVRLVSFAVHWIKAEIH